MNNNDTDEKQPVDLSSLSASQFFLPSWMKDNSGLLNETISSFSAVSSALDSDMVDVVEWEKKRKKKKEKKDKLTKENSDGKRERSSRQMFDSSSHRGNEQKNSYDRDRDKHPHEKLEVIEGWKLTLIPKKVAVESIAKQVRSKFKAYPLFELTRLILKFSERYDVYLKADSVSSPSLFRLAEDGSLWRSASEAISQFFAKYHSKFYDILTIDVEPPKGAFTVVAQCSMSGALLGPPNHHEYTSKLIEIHTSKFKDVPFDIYKSRINMVRDIELIAKWKSEQSKRVVYRVVQKDSKNEADKIVQNSDSHDESTLNSSQNSFAEKVNTEVSEEYFSCHEAIEHFKQNYMHHEIAEVKVEVTVPGHVLLHSSTLGLRNLLLQELRELDRFPLPLAQCLSHYLSMIGLQLFKDPSSKIVHVAMTRPKYLDRTVPIAENFCSILDFLEKYRELSRDQQWNGLLALREENGENDEQTLILREKALSSDLLWLLNQGYVIDFALGNFQVATPSKNQHAKKIAQQSVATDAVS